jgi:hypothetical protein
VDCGLGERRLQRKVIRLRMRCVLMDCGGLLVVCEVCSGGGGGGVAGGELAGYD